MAILKGIQITVEVDGTALQEYEDTATEGNTDFVSKYIESTSDVPFAVKIEVPPDFRFVTRFLSVRLNADGTCVERRSLNCKDMKTCAYGYWYRINGIRIKEGGQRYEMPLAFRKIKTYDDDTESFDENGSNTGIVTLKIHRVKSRRLIPTKHSGQDLVNRLQSNNNLHEELLKRAVVSHSIGLGEKKPITPYDYCASTLLDPQESPYVSFAFKYRSRDILISHGLIQVTPSSNMEDGLEALEVQQAPGSPNLPSITGRQNIATAGAEEIQTTESIEAKLASTELEVLQQEFELAKAQSRMEEARLRLIKAKANIVAGVEVGGKRRVKPEEASEKGTVKRARINTVIKKEVVEIMD